MKYFLLFALSFISGKAISQNLVPNPSFEDTVYCSDLGRLSGCKYWVNCRATPDYDNACHTGAYSVPSNTFGFQPAATGQAYCQIGTYFTSQLYREYIGTQLIEPMIPGHTYNVAFKCAPGNIESGYCIKSNKLGIRFSTVEFDSSHPAPIDNFAHLYTNNIVSDTLNWTSVNGVFTADSAYSFLVVGNFFDNANTDTAGPCWSFGAYYIDDVEVLDSGTSIEQLLLQQLTVTQCGGYLKIAIRDEPITQFIIYNSLGQLFHEMSDVTTKSATVETSAFPPGLYILYTKSQHYTYCKKFLIR